MLFLRRRREIEEVATVDTSALIQIVYAMVCFLVGIAGFTSNKRVREIQLKTPLKFLLGFHILALISTIWSVSPSLTGYRSFECIAYTLLIATALNNVIRKNGVEVLVKWVLFYATIAIIASIIGRARLGGMDIFSLQTLFTEQMNSTPYFFFALLLPASFVSKALILSISIFSLSNTAYAGMGLGSYGLSSGNRWLKIIFFTSIILLIAFLSIYGVNAFLQNTLFYGKGGVGLEYTTGRNTIFEYSWEEAQKRPFTGYGFVAGDAFVINKRFQGVIGAHNGVLSSLLGMGYPGALLFILFLIKMFFLSKRRIFPSIYRSVFLGSVILLSVHTMGNPGLGTRVYGTWKPAVVIFTTICTVYLHFKRKERRFEQASLKSTDLI